MSLVRWLLTELTAPWSCMTPSLVLTLLLEAQNRFLVDVSARLLVCGNHTQFGVQKISTCHEFCVLCVFLIVYLLHRHLVQSCRPLHLVQSAETLVTEELPSGLPMSDDLP